MTIDISNIKKCITDSKKSWILTEQGPSDPTNYSELMGRLENSRLKLPVLYRESVFDPFFSKLQELGEIGFNSILLNDKKRDRDAGVMLDIAQTILQNAEGYNQLAIDAFQEVVSDLYDGFLSEEDRRGIKKPNHMTIAPLVKFGLPELGPYTLPVEVARNAFNVQTTIVSLPPAHTKFGLLGWATLAHETGGHDILNADDGLLKELSIIVNEELQRKGFKDDIPEYWSSRIDETASDVLGILNMGYAAAIGLIGYFRGIEESFGREPKLRNKSGAKDEHPVDILRGYLAASTVRLLSFTGALEWGKIIEDETNKDLLEIKIGDKIISSEVAKKSAEIVAKAIAETKLTSLENHSLREIQDWGDIDEGLVIQLEGILNTANKLPVFIESGMYAAHVVSAAVVSALSREADLDMIFSKMLIILKMMHSSNPSWGPLSIRHPGDAFRHMLYQPLEEEEREKVRPTTKKKNKKS